MLTVLKEARMADGSWLRVTRFRPPGEYPLAMWRYLMEAFKCDDHRRNFIQHAYWRLDYRERLDGHYADYTEDNFYCAQVDDVYAASLWFGYSKRSGRGNFGNVYTMPAYRRRGLMTELLLPCVEDFAASPAKMLCCSSGNPYAVASYCKVGFRLIYGGEKGPLCLMKTDEAPNFLAAAEQAFAGKGIALLRPGHPGDQFDCDKFLFYAPSIYQGGRHVRRGPAAQTPDYRIALQEVLQGNGVQWVAENAAGTMVGYAHALRLQDHGILDFTVHGDYIDAAPELIQATASAFKAKMNMSMFFFAAPTDQEKISLVERSGGVLAGKLSGALGSGDRVADLLVFKIDG
ncbi:MAG: GNAT family N-acetyltransferase [Lentisphaerae bacterium]|nr:GNAT family N-acetyltransferase [Lentisphaerota bacterium]HQL88326.1 GNAT family N-acetyltransferase [Lentisphaeria bacterium]